MYHFNEICLMLNKTKMVNKQKTRTIQKIDTINNAKKTKMETV